MGIFLEMIHTIPYTPLPGLEETGVMAPMIEIIFTHNKYLFPTVALVDSGAEASLISTIIAEKLNIDWVKLPQFTGYTPGGKFTYRRAKNLQASIFDHDFRLDVAIAEGVHAFKCILGRRDIFKQAKITFEGYRNQFHIEFRNLN